MEADSTTYDNNPKELIDGPCLPFNTCPGNLRLYAEFVHNNADKSIDCQLFERLLNFGLLQNHVKCMRIMPNCKLICRPARVVDRLQWVCEACGKKEAIRDGSFFFRLQCSLLQALQMILSWCEDADCNVVAEHFGVKIKVANQIYDRLDELAIKQFSKTRLGGANSVVLAEMFPDCLNRLSPDTTDHPHVHRILMLADTKHIPTYYRLHVIREDPRRTNAMNSNRFLVTQIENLVSKSVTPESTLITSTTVPTIDGAVPIQQLTQQCDGDMQQFLSSRIWKQAITVCAASRDLCASATVPTVCVAAVQRYLDSSLYRLRYGDGFFEHMLNVIVDEYANRNLPS